MGNRTALETVSIVLLIVGGLNWGLVGLFEFNLVDSLFGEGSLLSQLVYILVGLAALFEGFMLTKGATAGDKKLA